MRIAICDDEITSLNQISQIVQGTFEDMELKYSIYEFTNSEDLLKRNRKYDLIFLDVELGDENKNGVWIAKQIKQKAPDTIIIFVTNYEEYIDEVIEKYAFRYWSKPIDAYRLRKSINEVVERIKTLEIAICDGKFKKNIEIPMRDIIFITPENKHCKIVAISGEYICVDSFKEIKGKFIAKKFCSCHGSYIVNLNFVEKYTPSYVYLRYKNKKYTVHMSRRNYKGFKEQMFIVGGEKV